MFSKRCNLFYLPSIKGYCDLESKTGEKKQGLTGYAETTITPCSW